MPPHLVHHWPKPRDSGSDYRCLAHFFEAWNDRSDVHIAQERPDMTDLTTYPLRLPRSIKAGVEQLSKQDGISINQFVTIAVAEKLAIMQAESYFAERAARADMTKFDELMARSGGTPPVAGDEA
jgi:hypothetical protein